MKFLQRFFTILTRTRTSRIEGFKIPLMHEIWTYVRFHSENYWDYNTVTFSSGAYAELSRIVAKEMEAAANEKINASGNMEPN
jgi:hypothetical protein